MTSHSLEPVSPVNLLDMEQAFKPANSAFLPKYTGPRPTVLSWIVLCVGLLATVMTSLQVRQVVENEVVKQFAYNCDQVTLQIQERLGAYALILRGGAALFSASRKVERLEWRDYVETLRASGSIPGVQGIGFAQFIQPDKLAIHTEDIRAAGFPDYAVRPSGERTVYTSIVYLEPFNERNQRAFGFDMFSEPVRRAAMERARDTGDAAMSGKVELVQETATQVQAGALMYVPVYRNGALLETVVQRRAALIGWSYSPYRMNDLMTGILRDWVLDNGSVVALSIYDGADITPAGLLYDNKPQHAFNARSLFFQQRPIDFNGHQWQLVFDNASATTGISYVPAWATLIVGAALTGMLFGLLLSISNTRDSAARIANKLTREIRNQERLLKESEFRWKFAIEGSGDGMWDWNVTEGTVFYSRTWKAMLGYAEDEIGNGLEEWEKRLHPDDKTATLAAVKAYLDGETVAYINEHRVQCKDGSYKWVLDRGMVVNRSADGKALRLIGTHTDIDQRKQLENEVRLLAFRDPLTQLANRRLLVERLSYAMAAGKRSGLCGALMFLDLDHFKPLNDTWGHDAGDALLKEVARRLKSCVREIDTVSRFGGDEFVVLLSELGSDKLKSTGQAGIIAEKIRAALAEPFLLTINKEGQADLTVAHQCTASIGIIVFTDHEWTRDDLLKGADVAMYEAKEAGRNLIRFYQQGSSAH